MTKSRFASIAAGISGFLLLFTGTIFRSSLLFEKVHDIRCKLTHCYFSQEKRYLTTIKASNRGGVGLNRKVGGWIPEPLWQEVKANVPIACVDVIVPNHTGAVLLGWRVIQPYSNVWATPGGRIRMGETLAGAARRVLSSHGLAAERFYLVGVFPVRFPSRFDISICVATGSFHGTPVPDGTEFKKIGWFRNLRKNTGKNYIEMIEKWRKIRKSAYVMKLNRI